jgi:hypothetical protein
MCDYWQAITFFTEELPRLSASDQEWVMGRAAGEWLGGPLLACSSLAARGHRGRLRPGVSSGRIAH